MPEEQPPSPDPQEEQMQQPDRPFAERRFVQRQIVQPLIQWMPLGGSGWLFASFLLKQEWMQVLLTFPVTVVTAVWAAYSQNFVERLSEIYAQKGKEDADAVKQWLDSLNQALLWQFSGFEGNYLKCQANFCRDYATEGFSHPTGILMPMLEQVFVPLQLGQDEFLAGFQQPCEGAEKNKTLSIWDLLAQVRQVPAYRKMAILAWGGYGKTTLMRHIAYTYANNRQRKYRAPKLTPVLLYLRKWRDELAKPDAPSLPELITRHIQTLPGAKGLKIPPNWVEYRLRGGAMLVMLDGFDEVADGQRETVSHWITAQMQEYDQAVFILTSRPGGYKDYTAEKPTVSLVVQPFQAEQRQRFVEQWYLCQERFVRAGRKTPEVKAAAHEQAANLLAQIDRRKELRDMTQSPLMLNLMTTYHRMYQGQELPRHRADLYQAICGLQLGDRPLAKRVELPLDNAAARQRVLQGLALEMVQQNLVRVPQTQAVEIITPYVAAEDPAVDPARLLQAIVKVSELLVEREFGEYEFAHLSFQGYLAASQVRLLQQESLLLDNWQQQNWRETILLYAAQVNPSELVKSACQLGPTAAPLAWACTREFPRPLDADLLAQVRELRYRLLEDYLQAGEWQKADYETYGLMITRVGKEEGDFFMPDELLNFPCEDLLRIDRLWVKYSQGVFGFSVQKKIWQDCGSPTSYKEVDWREFGDRVGWRGDGDWLRYSVISSTVSLSSPQGIFPYWWVDWGRGGCLFSRAETCEL